MNKLMIFIAVAVSIIGCGQRRHVAPIKETVKCYKERRAESTDSLDLWIYWYFIYDNSSRSYYYTSSSSPLSSYSSSSWTQSKSLPPSISGAKPSEITEEEVPTEDLGQAADEIEAANESAPENSLDSMEGVPESSPTESGGSSDSGSSSSDGGGGGDSGSGE